MKVLLVGEDSLSVEPVRIAVHLRWPDVSFVTTADLEQAVGHAEAGGFDIVVAMASLLRGAVPRFCHRVRETSDVPLVVIGAGTGDQEFESVKALEAGADDYVRNTAGIVELVARFVALMRRAQAHSRSDDSVVRCGNLLLKQASYEAFVNDKKIDLTATEFMVLQLLMRSQGSVVRHRAIERALWGDNVDSSALVKKYIHRVRRKLEDATNGEHDYIRSVYGVGYMLVSDQSAVREMKVPA